jgi:hypothetical protein
MIPAYALVGDNKGKIHRVDMNDDMQGGEDASLWRDMHEPIVNIVVHELTVAIMTTKRVEIVSFSTDEVMLLIRNQDLGENNDFRRHGMEEDSFHVSEGMSFSKDGSIFALAYGPNVYLFTIHCGIPTVKQLMHHFNDFDIVVDGFMLGFPVQCTMITNMEFSDDRSRLLISGLGMSPQIWELVYGTFLCSMGAPNWDHPKKIRATNTAEFVNSETVIASYATFRDECNTVMYCLEHTSMSVCNLIVVEIDTWNILRHWCRDSNGGGHIYLTDGGDYGACIDSSDGGLHIFDQRDIGECTQPIDDQVKGDDVTHRFPYDDITCHVNNANMRSSMWEDPREEIKCTCEPENPDAFCALNCHKGDFTFITYFPVDKISDYQMLATGGMDKSVIFWKLCDSDVEYKSTQFFDEIPTCIGFAADPAIDPDRILAFAMGNHERLGQASVASSVTDDLIRRHIFKHKFAK